MELSFQTVMSQVMLGLNNGVFYAILSLGLAVIFGLLNIVNFVHGALYMLGAYVALLGYTMLGPLLGKPDFHLNYWAALIVAPLVVGLLGVGVERTMLRRLRKFDHLYGLLLTFGLALIIQGVFTNYFNVSGDAYEAKPEALNGAVNLGFMMFPKYRLWVIAISLLVCFATWFVIERTKLGSYLRAGTENPELVKAFEAHSDYIRGLAVHPTLPYVLSCSDDMLIKLWDWDKGWACTQVFEGHSHYVMAVSWNPKDTNTFASASLDRTLKVWSLGQAVPNFTLEGHDKGVNCCDYCPGGDRPYLVSGADEFVKKPFNIEKIIERIVELLEIEAGV